MGAIVWYVIGMSRKLLGSDISPLIQISTSSMRLITGEAFGHSFLRDKMLYQDLTTMLVVIIASLPAPTQPMIEYRHNFPLNPMDIVRVFDLSGITRPTDDIPRIARMFAASNLVISAWANGVLVGVCRALTDDCYCCYLSDLAVDQAFQKRGIGTELIRRVQSAVGDSVSIILLSAPGAMSYYPTVGFSKAENAFVIRRVQ